MFSFFFLILTAVLTWPPVVFSTLLITRFLYGFLLFCLFLKCIMFSSFFILQLFPGHVIRSHDFSDLYAGNFQTFILGAYSLQRSKLPSIWLVMEHFCLTRLEISEIQHVQRELIFNLSLLLASNQLLSPLNSSS